MTQNIMTSALEASGPKKYFSAFSILLDGLAHISAIFLLKMQKSLKSAHPIRHRTGKCIEFSHTMQLDRNHIWNPVIFYPLDPGPG
jgi:hypothetical protein